MFKRQKQKAGDNSQQIQAGVVNCYSGIDEERARQIVEERVPEIIQNYSIEAYDIAEERINYFTNNLIPELVNNELLEWLKNPSIQVLISDAQKTAISTEREADYELLSELIIHRINKEDDRNSRTGIKRAVQIVDEISNEALLGLTVAQVAMGFVPMSGGIDEGLNIFSNSFEKIIYGELPEGYLWIEQLDILDALRMNQMSSFMKSREFLSNKFSGYLDVGISKTSENYSKAIELLNEAHLPLDLLITHELRSGYVRLNIYNINNIDNIVFFKLDQFGKIQTQDFLTENQQESLKKIYDLYEDGIILREENIDRFMKKWDSYKRLKEFREWWDALPVSFSVTSVGRVLAHSNAKRCDPNLPDFN